MWPRARPDIIGTLTPQAATMGARTRETLSPTPPVECLSTKGPAMPERSMTLPERSMTSVRSAVSALLMPLKKTAMSQAETWYSGTDPAT